MGSKSRRKPKPRGQIAGLSEHKRQGTQLVSPLGSLNMTDIVWVRDFSPECLWIASLTDIVGLEYLHKPYYALMDVMDSVWPHTKDIALGMISDFGEVPTTARLGFFERTHFLLMNSSGRPWLRSLASIQNRRPHG